MMDSRNAYANQQHIVFWKATSHSTNPNPYYLWNKESAGQPLAKTASLAAENASSAAYMTLPVITAEGIALLSHKGGYVSLAPIGIPFTIGGVVLDAVKAPFCFAFATEETVRAGITKLLSVVLESQPTEKFIHRIFNSFLIRMQQTATLLVAMQLEDAAELDKKLQSGDIEELVGFTFLHTAYASRHYHSGLLLASNKTLMRNDCPEEGLPLFDKIMGLKKSIQIAFELSDSIPKDLSNQERELAESRVVCAWIRLIKAGKKVEASMRSDATPQQIGIVNTIIAQIEDLKRSGMVALPASPESLATQLPRFNK